MDPKVANTVAYVGTVLLRAYEADAVPAADTPAQPYVPVIYRSLMLRDGLKPEPDDVIDLNTGERVGLPAADGPCALPAHPPSAVPMKTSQPNIEIDLEILDY
jgi:hypothetical protein